MQVYEFMARSTDAISGTLIPSLLYIDVFEITILSETISGQRFEPPLHADHYRQDLLTFSKINWGARIRTWEWRDQNPLPYRLATPHWIRCTRIAAHSLTVSTALGKKFQWLLTPNVTKVSQLKRIPQNLGGY